MGQRDMVVSLDMKFGGHKVLNNVDQFMGNCPPRKKKVAEYFGHQCKLSSSAYH
jgi:hypothetical protein